MSEFGQRFVIDTNALVHLGRHRRASRFFLENAVIPEEVMYEASGIPDITYLGSNVHPTTASVLHWLTTVMSTVPSEDTRLVDLYANKGNADPLVVACALDGQERDSHMLIRPEWVVVTADEAVRKKAREFELTVLSNSEFVAVIDSNSSGVSGQFLGSA